MCKFNSSLQVSANNAEMQTRDQPSWVRSKVYVLVLPGAQIRAQEQGKYIMALIYPKFFFFSFQQFLPVVSSKL